MKTNNKPTTCDLETVVTAQITIIDRDVEIDEDCDLIAYAESIKAGVKRYFKNQTDDCGLDDEQIKVQLFVHEKQGEGE